MHFQKMNYQRGKVKEHLQNQLDALVKGKTEAEIRELHRIFLEYDDLYSHAVMRFEGFIRSRLDRSFFVELRRFNLEKKIEKRKSDAESTAKKMRELKITFQKKSFLGKIFEPEQEKFLRDGYHFTNSHINELSVSLRQGSEVFDYWSTLRIEQFFFQRYGEDFEREQTLLAEIGIGVNSKDGKINLGLSTEEVAAVVAGSIEYSSLSLGLNYTQKYWFFMYDKMGVGDYFNKTFSKLTKKKEERNLRALAAERIDRQRSLASAHRTLREYKNQIFIFDCCPYCCGELGPFNGDNAAHLEHIHPVSKGGLSTIENTVFICSSCNSKKSNMTLNSFISNFSLERDAVFERLTLLGKDF